MPRLTASVDIGIVIGKPQGCLKWHIESLPWMRLRWSDARVASTTIKVELCGRTEFGVTIGELTPTPKTSAPTEKGGLTMSDEYSKCNFCANSDIFARCGWCCEKDRYKPDKQKIIEKAKSVRISVADVIALIHMED